MKPRDKQTAGSDLEGSDLFSLELTLVEMGFLRLLLTNAALQPAELKKARSRARSRPSSGRCR